MDALERYIESPPPGYALLVAGTWGVGKSFFWHKFAQRLTALNKKPITISVAGLESRDDLESAIFQASIEEFGPAALREATKVIGRSLLRYVNIEPNEIRLKADFQSGSTVVCIDDIERFGGDFLALFGFIVNLVDSAKVHCVLIADEEKAEERHEDYRSFKERIVGKTIGFTSDTEAFCRDCLNGLRSQRVRELLLPYLTKVVETFRIRKIENLRALRYFITEFADVVERARPDRRADLTPLLSSVAFWAIATAKSSANLKLVSNAFQEEQHVLYFHNQDEDQGGRVESLNERTARLLADLQFREDVYYWPRSAEFSNLVASRPVDYQRLAEDFHLTEELCVPSEGERVSRNLQNFRELSDLQLQESITEARALIQSGDEKNLSLVFDMFRSLHFLSEVGLFAIDPNEWCQEAINNIRQYDSDAIAPTAAAIEVFGVQLSDGERRVLNEVRALAERVEREGSRRERDELIRKVLETDEPLPDLVGSRRLFAGVEPAEFQLRLRRAGTQAVVRLHRMIRTASRIGGAGQFLAEDAPFYRQLAEEIRAAVEVTVPMTMLNAEMIALSRGLDELADFVAPIEHQNPQ